MTHTSYCKDNAIVNSDWSDHDADDRRWHYGYVGERPPVVTYETVMKSEILRLKALRRSIDAEISFFENQLL